MGYLEKIFRALNAKYFDNTLEEPIWTRSGAKIYRIFTLISARPPVQPTIAVTAACLR